MTVTRPPTSPTMGHAPAVRSLRLALWQLALAGSALAAVEIALYPTDGGTVWLLIAYSLVGVLFLAAGVLAWQRRPSNRTGHLLCLAGLSVLAAAAGNTSVPALVTLGEVTGELAIGVVLHLLLAFPSGRLRDRRSQALALAGYAVTFGLQVPRFLPHPGPGIAAALSNAQDVAGGLVIVLSALLLVQRLRAADAAHRRILALLSSYGIFTLLFLEGSYNIALLLHLGPYTLFGLQLAVFAGIPVAFLAGVLRGGFARTGELEELATWLGSADGGRPTLREALSATLGDASLDVWFWLPDDRRYVDAHGREVAPQVAPERGFVEVALAGRPVGAIVYDASLIPDTELVRMAGRVIALAMERDRLTVALLANREALRESRARLVEAGDRERRRFARDLHDGLQGRLVLLAVQAGCLGTEALELRRGLEEAIGELRRLVQGVMPALLIERGLYAATEELVDRLPIRAGLHVRDRDRRLAPAVETAAYFIIAEALANAVKHSRARDVQVCLACPDERLEIEVRDDGVGGVRPSGGSGLRGISDRVEALGGRLLVDSPDGAGTRLWVEIPCGS